jgi:hypothetical protein
MQQARTLFFSYTSLITCQETILSPFLCSLVLVFISLTTTNLPNHWTIWVLCNVLFNLLIKMCISIRISQSLFEDQQNLAIMMTIHLSIHNTECHVFISKAHSLSSDGKSKVLICCLLSELLVLIPSAQLTQATTVHISNHGLIAHQPFIMLPYLIKYPFFN